MPNWVELVTENNIGSFIDGATYVDTRVIFKGNVYGFWNRSKDICPYLMDMAAYTAVNTTIPSTQSANSYSSAAYMLGMGHMYRLGFTTGTTDVFSTSDPDGTGLAWRPQLDKNVINHAIYNPFDTAYRILESRMEFRYPSQNSTLVNHDMMLSLSWATFDNISTNSHQERYVSTNSANSNFGNSLSYNDSVSRIPLDIIGGNSNSTTSGAVHIVGSHSTDQDDIPTSSDGYQGTDVLPSMSSGNVSDDIIEGTKALVPILGGFPDNTAVGTAGWLGTEPGDYETGTNDWGDISMMQWRNFQVTLTTILQKVT